MTVSHRVLLGVVAALAVAAIAAIVVLWPPPDDVEEPDEALERGELVEATIVDIERLDDLDDPGLPPGAINVVLVAELEATGALEVFPMGDETGDLYEVGQQVWLEPFERADGETDWLVADFQRGPAMLALTGLFVLAVLGLGRWQGVRALAGLAVTFAVIVGFMVPAILAGRSPVAVALAGSVAIMIVTLYLAHGLNRKSTAAVVGTTGALALTVGLAALFVEVATITGFTDEQARFANIEVGGLSLRGLLLAGIIVGALGVLDDVTMSQASTVFALRRTAPHLGFGALVGEALAVGRDHVAATVNTLFLAYAGAALPLLILFTTADVGAGELVTAEVVAVEVVRTLVGSIGLVAAVPITTALAAGVALADAPAAADDPDPHAAHAHALEPSAEPPAADAAPTVDVPPDAEADAAAEPADRPADGAPDDEPPSDEGPAPGEDVEEWERRLRRSYGLDDPGPAGPSG